MKLNFALRLTVLATLLAMTLSPGLSFAAEDQKALEAHGALKSFDEKDHSLVITQGKDHSEHRFLWNDQTKFSVHGKSTSANELQAGARLHLTYAAGGDVPILQSVNIMPPRVQTPPPQQP